MADSGLLSEHEPAVKPTDHTDQYDPTPEEKKTIKLAKMLFEKAKRHRSLYDNKWLDYYKMFRGKQWKEQRPSYRHSEVINLIHQNLQSMVPILTDSHPKFEFLPQEPADLELAEILNEVAQADWQKNNWMLPLTEVLYDGHIYGTGLSCMKFDSQLNHGAGGIQYESSDPFYSFPDPSAFDVNVRSDFFCYAEPLDIAVIKRKYPKYAKFIKADLLDLMKSSKTDLAPTLIKSPVANMPASEGSNTQELIDKDRALLITVYCKSDEFIEEPVTKQLEDGKTETTYLQKLRWPGGRKIVICNEILLEDGDNPYDDREYPYQRWVNYILPREFWGMSEIEQLEGPQKVFNKLVSFALDVLTLMGNPVWKVHTSNQIDVDNLTNKPGLVVEYEGEVEPKREEGVQLQPFVLQLIDRMKEWFDQIGGANDITRGVNPTGVTANSAIENLMNAAQTRVRQKSRNLDCYLQSLGQQYLSRVFQFYSAPEVFRLTGKDGSQKYFKFHVSKDERSGAYTAEIDRYDAGGLRQYETKGKFDVRVTTGSSLPFSKAEKEKRLLELFDRGIVDAEEVLKTTDYPNYEAVLMRVQQKAMADAQAAAQAKAQGAPPAAA